MRIIPACLFAYTNKMETKAAVKMIHEVSGLTHNHLRSCIGCGLYYFCICAILDGAGSLMDRLQNGLNAGFDYYDNEEESKEEISHYNRLRNLAEFGETTEDGIKSSGYVVASLEAAVWSLLKTDCFEAALLKAVNLGDDSDTVGAIAGGMAGLFYGYDAMPQEWLDVIKKREWIENLCQMD